MFVPYSACKQQYKSKSDCCLGKRKDRLLSRLLEPFPYSLPMRAAQQIIEQSFDTAGPEKVPLCLARCLEIDFAQKLGR